MANKELGAKLRALRIRNGLTQKNVYEQLGVSQSTFSSWEIGKSEPDAVTFLKLCDIYHVQDILFEFTGKTTENNEIFTASNVEKNLIYAYRDLSIQGQEYILNQMEIASSLYKKSSESKLCDKKVDWIKTIAGGSTND